MRKKIFSFKVFLTGIILLGFFLINSSLVLADEWTQHAHDSQRTGYSSEEPEEPWTFKWHWQPDNMSTMPRGAHPVTGGDYIYMPGGAQGLYAVRKSNGIEAWRVTTTSFKTAPAYDPSTGYLYAGGSNGKLYKINTSNGSVMDSYHAGSGINHEVLLIGKYAYVVTDNGELHKVDTNSMSLVWKYSAGSAGTTGAAYSATKDLLIFGTKDLYVHTINDSNGSQKWKKKPTSLPAGDCYSYSFEYGWPVIADQHGIVLMRMRLGPAGEWQTDGVNPGARYPLTNSQIKAYLDANPKKQSLFALDLSDGSKKFTSAVANGGVDTSFTYCDGEKFTQTIGPMPVVKISDGKEVAYTIWRNGQTVSGGDWRADGHMGEMVLDDNTVSNYKAGDVRFIDFNTPGNKRYIISDEQCPITIAGKTIFHAHWGASDAYTILDRSNSQGNSFASPITTERKPPVIRRIDGRYAGNRNDQTHWTNGSLILYCDGKSWLNSGFWVYWDEVDPPGTCEGVGGGYGDDMRPRYTFVSDGMIYVVGNGGDIFALSHSGSSGPAPSPSPTPTPDPIADILTILVNWGNNGGDGDVNSDGKVNGVDFAQVIKEISN